MASLASSSVSAVTLLEAGLLATALDEAEPDHARANRSIGVEGATVPHHVPSPFIHTWVGVRSSPVIEYETMCFSSVPSRLRTVASPVRSSCALPSGRRGSEAVVPVPIAFTSACARRPSASGDRGHRHEEGGLALELALALFFVAVQACPIAVELEALGDQPESARNTTASL